MATQTLILDSNLIHTLSLTPENLEQLGLRKDSALAVSLEGRSIVLHPADPIDALCGIFAANPGMTEELLEERRKEEAIREKKFGW